MSAIPSGCRLGLESGPLNTEYIILTFRTHLNTGEQACWLKTVFGTCKDRRRELAIKNKEQRARTHLQGEKEKKKMKKREEFWEEDLGQQTEEA